MVRRQILMAVAGLLLLGAAVPSPAATTVASYSARGTVAMPPGPPERTERFVASASLSQPTRGSAIGPAPARGTLSLSGVVRARFIPPGIIPPGIIPPGIIPPGIIPPGIAPNPCLGVVATGSMSITWNDGSRSTGTFRAVVAGPVLTWLGNIGSGRFKGAVVDEASLVGLTPQPEPPSCSAPFTGAVVVADPS